MIKRLMLFPAIALLTMPTTAPLLSTHRERDNVGHTLAVVVHKNNPIDGLTMDELRQIMTAERKFWSETDRIHILMREKDSWERSLALQEIYRMSEKDYSKYWLKQIYRGRVVAPPTVLPSDKELIDAIKGDGDAIGYADGSIPLDEVKTLLVDGKNYMEDGYPLKKLDQ